jgi:hypothetical protein
VTFTGASARSCSPAAFEAFPDKLYCVLTLPHDSPEPPLVSTFTRIAPIPGSTFPEVLYIFNRCIHTHQAWWEAEHRGL